MKKEWSKKIFATMLSAAMAVSMAACGGGEGTGAAEGTGGGGSAGGAETAGEATGEQSRESTASESGQAGTDEVTTITLYPKDAMLQSGVIGGYKGELFAQYGIAVDVWAYSDEKTNAILAGGALPDVMCVSKDNLEIMIEGGMALNLENYLDKLPNLTGNEAIATALNYVRNFNSAGTGELYAIPTVVGNKVTERGITKNMTAVNWKYYAGIGTPEFKDQWELIDVMEQMLEAYPAGADGIENFGIYLNSGSDSTYWGNMNQYLKWFGYEPTELPYLLEADMVHGKYASILDSDSKYYEGLKWYNEVYRRGLMDPDSINSDRATQKAKVDAGYAMVPAGTVQGYEAGGYMPVYMEGQELYQESWNSVYGNDYVMVVSARSENIDAALRYINMMADPDAYMVVQSGPEGDLWYVENGVAYIREDVPAKIANHEAYPLENGEEISLWAASWVIDDASYPTSYTGPDGEPRGTRIDRWDETLDLVYDTENQNEWREMSGYDFIVDQLIDKGAYTIDSELDNLVNFTAIPDDMMQLKIDSIKSIVVDASWKMVYAETEEEFQEIWDKMVEDCSQLGAQEVIDWRLGELENAKKIRDSLSE